MTVRHAGILMTAVLGVFASQASAALVVPVKAYFKPDEPIVVKFLMEKGEAGKKAVQEIGLAAAKLDELFAPVVDAENAVKIYTAAGEELKLAAVKVTADGTADLSALTPKLKEGGTYYLVWKDAPPLVIETLFNPGRGAPELDRIKGQLAQMSADQRKETLSHFAPAVTHIEMAEIAVITTDKGVIKAKFSYEVAPHTVDNFISLSQQGFYDGSGFHRIISGFMIQGGDAYTYIPGLEGTGGPGYEIMKEFSDKKHERGSLSMARSSDPNSAGSQFFIMHAKSPNLDGAYSAFGDVIDGMDVVDAIAKTPVADSNGTVKGPKPKILSVKILPATAEAYGLKK